VHQTGAGQGAGVATNASFHPRRGQNFHAISSFSSPNVSQCSGRWTQRLFGCLRALEVEIRTSKHEIRNKSEFQMFKTRNLPPEETVFDHLRFEIWSLFRISIFEFRISNAIIVRVP
jgi:hypothetical protein